MHSDAQSPTLRGRCHCGEIRFEISGDVGAATICHCRSCQRTAGAESVGWVEVESHQVTLAGKTLTRFASSKGIERTFCSQCGCAMSYQREPSHIDLVIATLDHPERVEPTREIWLDHRISWNALNDGLTHVSTQ
ncbi:MAG: GFA family protein [Lysobacterales bacterium]